MSEELRYGGSPRPVRLRTEFSHLRTEELLLRRELMDAALSSPAVNELMQRVECHLGIRGNWTGGTTLK